MAVTRLGLSGFSRPPYGDFADKVATEITDPVDIVPAFTSGSATRAFTAGSATRTFAAGCAATTVSGHGR